MRKLDGAWLATLAALALAMVAAWPSEFVDDRPMCSGVPKLTYPHRDGCYGDELPAFWALTHPSALGLVLLGATAALAVAWLFLRSRDVHRR